MEDQYKTNQTKMKSIENSHDQRVEQLLKQYQKKNKDFDLRTKHNSSKTAQSSFLLQNSWRKWLFQKGKGYLVDFDQQERKKLKDFFNTLDRKKCGSIGLNQLEEMLLGLGLADGLEEVQKLIGNVDGDHSGKIQFQEFIQMIQDESQENQVIVNFFKQLIFSQMRKSKQKQTLLSKLNFSKTTKPTESQKQILKNNLPFEMIVNQIRRNHILSSMSVGRCKPKENARDFNRVSKGKYVVKALQKMEQRRIMRKLRQNSVLVQQSSLRS